MFLTRPSTNRLGLMGSLIWLSCFLSGCATVTATKVIPPRKLLSTEEILSQTNLRNDQISSLRTITSLTLATPDGQRNFNAVLIVQKPHFIRLEVLNMFMQPIQFIILNENELIWYLPGDKKVFRGESTGFNIYRIIGIRISVTELVDILLGCAPLPPSNDVKPSLSYLNDANRYQLQFCQAADLCPDKIWLDPYKLYGVKSVHDSESPMGWGVDWGEFRQLKDYYLPTNIRLERVDKSNWVEFEYRKPKINEPLAEDTFLFDLPAGVETVLLDGQVEPE